MSCVLFALIALALGCFMWSRRQLYILTWKFGGRLGYPFIGNILEYINEKDKNVFTNFGGNLVEAIWRINKSPRCVWLGNDLNIFIKDAKTAHMILTSNNLLEKHILYNLFHMLTGKNGIICVKAELWKVNRRIIDQSFSYNNIMNSVPGMNKAFDVFIEKTIKPMIDKSEADIHKDLENVVLQLKIELVTGKGLKWLQTESNYSIIENCRKIQKSLEERAGQILLHSDFIYKFTKNYRISSKLVAQTHRIIQDLILNNDSSDSLEYKMGGSSISDILRKHSGEEGFSDYDNCCQILGFIAAGHETTYFATFVTIFNLAMYPEYQDKLYNELVSFYPSKYPTVESDSIGQLQYLDMVISESLRLYPPVPLVGRSALNDTTLSDGTFIPKGVKFQVDIMSLQRNEKYWGPDADKFNPDNFLPANKEHRHRHAFIPYSIGKRNCIGYRLANIEMKVALAKLFRTFKLTTTSKMDDMRFRRGLSQRFVKPPLIAVTERSR